MRAWMLLMIVCAGCGGADHGSADTVVAADETSAEDTADVTIDTAHEVDAPVTHPELAAAPSTRGTELWVGFMENLSLASNGPPTFVFFVSAPGASAAVVGHVEVPQTGYSQAFEVPLGELVKVTMPSGTLYPQLNEVPSKLGVRISADEPLDVVAVHYRVYFSEASRILPTSELGDEYVVVTAVDQAGESPSEVVVVATEDGTEIALEPSTVTTGFLATGMEHRFTLNRGELIQFQAGGDLSGSRVRALGGQRIAVFAGARQANIGCRGADSHLWDQMIPVARWGTRHVVVPLQGAGATPLKVVADRVKTVVSVSCQDDAIVNPGMGATIAIAKPSVITSNEPVGVVALLKSNNCNLDANGDPNMVVVPPIGLTTTSFDWQALADYETFTSASQRVDIVTRDPVLLDGAPVVTQPIDGTDLVFAQLEVAAGRHRLAGAGFQAIAYGEAPFDAYSFGSGWVCTACMMLGQPVAASACDAGDLRLDRVPDGPDGDPEDPDPDPVHECTSACDCYAKPLVDVCAGSEQPDARPVWSCDGQCRPACGSPCEACPALFPTTDGRCIVP